MCHRVNVCSSNTSVGLNLQKSSRNWETITTALQAYTALQVPEIWRYHNRTLQIYLWRNGHYVESPGSPTFPQLPVIEGITQFLEMGRERGTARALRAFRHWLREHIQA